MTDGSSSEAELRTELERLEAATQPIRQQLEQLRREADAIRTELRRRERQLGLEMRQAVRRELAAGEMPTLEEAIESAERVVALEDLRFLRESATEVRLGYASASRQSIQFTDGSQIEEAYDLVHARGLWQRGWEFGTPQARGVRIYPVGSRAERVVPPVEVHVAPRE